MLENVRCFVRAEVPLDAQVTVIIGQNGSGKTTIAEAIGSLAAGDHEGLREMPLRRGAGSGTIALFGADGEAPLAAWSQGPDGAQRTRYPPGYALFAYGQYRSLRPPARRRWQPAASALEILGPAFSAEAEPPAPDDLRDALRRPVARTLTDFDEYLFRDLAAYAALLEQQGKSNPGARRAWERLCEWLRQMDGPRLEGVELEARGGGREASFRRAGVALPLGELSDGYRAMLAVVLDLVIRYSQLFDGRDDPLFGRAIVVIDEVDLNLHPRWQRRVIEQLTSLFPGTQFVLTTHSPAVVQAAIDQEHVHVRVLVLDEGDDPERGTTVRPLSPQDIERLDGAEIDSVMVDEAVFDVVSRYSPTYERLEARAADLQEKLEKGLATRAERKELLSILDELQGLLAREDERERRGPLLSGIAKTQIGLLRVLDGQIDEREAKTEKASGKKERKSRILSRKERTTAGTISTKKQATVGKSTSKKTAGAEGGKRRAPARSNRG